MTRDEEIAQILRAQECRRLRDQEREERIELEKRKQYKAEILSGKRQMLHPGCKFCAGMIADLLSVDLMACARNTEKQNKSLTEPPILDSGK